MKYFLPFIFIAFFQAGLYSQAYFTSAASGNWNSPSSWTMVSGSSGSNYPVAGDSVIVLNGDAIQVNTSSQCQSLTIKGVSSLLLNTTSTLTVTNNVSILETSEAIISAGALTITGNLTVSQASTLLQNSGAISVLGLIFITAPGIAPINPAGTSLINIDGGLFNCVGTMTITGTSATKIAQLSIGNSAVNIVGSLATITANGKIIFTGTGALTLAGLVNTSNANFSAGNGKVIYVGIPGSNQIICPLIYNRLVITGAGNGSKTINSGNVVVTDTLTLLSDTLINNGGTLTLNNNATIVKTTGAILSVPIFAGQIDLLYNNVLKDTTGLEMPVATNVLRNLAIADISGLTLNADVTLSNQLTLQNGELANNNFILTINNPLGGIGADPAINRINGYVSGKINRTIGTSTGTRIFPFGINNNQGYREYKIEYITAPTAAGILSAQHFNANATSQSGLPLADGPVTLINTAPYYWQADALSGLAGGQYNLTLTAESTPGVTDYTLLRITKRPSSGGNWILDGVAGINSGTNTAPVVVRNGMSNFSQFTIAGSTTNTLPITLLSFTGNLQNGNILLKWKATDEINLAGFAIEKSTNSINFQQVGWVKSISNSNGGNDYAFIDDNVLKATNYYRLKLMDKDGKSNFSKAIAIAGSVRNQLLIYPTISNSLINISGSGNQSIGLYNANGAFIKTLIEGSNSISSLANGVYFIKTGLATTKIIKY